MPGPPPASQEAPSVKASPLSGTLKPHHTLTDSECSHSPSRQMPHRICPYRTFLKNQGSTATQIQHMHHVHTCSTSTSLTHHHLGLGFAQQPGATQQAQ